MGIDCSNDDWSIDAEAEPVASVEYARAALASSGNSNDRLPTVCKGSKAPLPLCRLSEHFCLAAPPSRCISRCGGHDDVADRRCLALVSGSPVVIFPLPYTSPFGAILPPANKGHKELSLTEGSFKKSPRPGVHAPTWVGVFR
jgi:hypothetical protein